MSLAPAVRKVVEPEHRRLLTDLKDVSRAQQRVFGEILQANQASGFGRRHEFARLHDPDRYRAKVPLHRYEDLASEIESMAAGEKNGLCGEAVCLFEETSGSSAAAKLIPYTRSSLHALRRALYPWLADLLHARPAVAAGRWYWGLSPVMRTPRQTRGRIPIGVIDDAYYFGESLGRHFASLSVVPPAVAGLSQLEAWRYLSLRYLIAAADLSLVSVWSPTFLTALLEAMAAHAGELVRDVADGTVRAGPQPATACHGTMFAPDRERAAALERALSANKLDTSVLWPRLDTISCWTDAGARRFVPALQAAFPQARIQGKGLLATEGVVSIPLTAWPFPVLAVNSAFFEFLDDGDHSYLAHELCEGQAYRVVMTTYGGLYRYDTGDYVRMRGWAHSAPMLEFIGRGTLVSDVCGEKLVESFVLERLPVKDGFAMLAPALRPAPHYVLFLDAARVDDAQASAFARETDRALAENPQYDYARRLGQLKAVRACRVRQPMNTYTEYANANGQRLGDIKPPVLRPETDWETRFIAVDKLTASWQARRAEP